MKILHITNSFSEGGVESLLLDTLPRMVQKGHQVELLALNKNNASLKDQLEHKGVKVRLGSYSRIYNPLNIFVISRILRRHKYDIVHANLFPTQYYVIAARWMVRDSRTRFVTTEHGTSNNRRKYPFFKYLDRFFLRQYDSVIAISVAVRNVLKEWTRTESTVIYNGIDLSRFSKPRKDRITRADVHIPEQATILIMVARFSNQKDHQTLIQAIVDLPNTFSIFIGTGDNLESCQKRAKYLGLEDRIRFVGYTPTPERYMSIADIGVLSTYYEGFGISVVEYMIMGLPTIVSDVPGMKEVMGDAVIRVIPQSVPEMRQAIENLITDKELYNSMSQKAIERAKLFDIQKTVSDYIQLYQNLL